MKNLNYKSIVVVLIFNFLTLISNFANAIQEFETVVKETQFNSSSKVVIDKNQIQKSHVQNVTSLLSSQANISVVKSNFTPNTIYMRGGDSSHILILVDDIPIYDTSSVQRTLNLNSINIQSIERIEIIKGSQSVTYGGQALSGVIKIYTLPKEIKNEKQIQLQTGSFDTHAESLSVMQKINDQSGFLARGSHVTKKSLSPVEDSKMTYPTESSQGELTYFDRNHPVNYYFKAQTLFDQTYISTTDYPSYRAAEADLFSTSNYFLNFSGGLTMPDSILKPNLSVSWQQTAKLFEQPELASSGNPTKQNYYGELSTLLYDMNLLNFNEKFKLNGGFQFISEKMIYKDFEIVKSDNASEFLGVFLKMNLNLFSILGVELGTRSDFILTDKNKKPLANDVVLDKRVQTYHVGLTFFDIFKAEYSTGFKQPSLFQLFSDYGNENLLPEKSNSYSVSVDWPISESLYFSYTEFITQFNNLIIIKGNPQKYENVQSSLTKGHELMGSYNDIDHSMTYNLSLGYQEPFDDSQQDWLVRRPLRTASLNIHKNFESQNQLIGLGVEVVHVGDRRDKTSQNTYGTLPAYTLAHITADYKPVSENYSVFVRAQNMTNLKYQTSYGFYDEGLNLILGVAVKF